MATYSGIEFTSVEENQTLYLVNYGSYTDIYNVLRSSSTTNNILDTRFDLKDDGGFTDIQQLDDVFGVDDERLYKLKQYAHIFDTRQFVNELGLTLPNYNFLMGLSGVIVGAAFLFVVVRTVTK